MKVYAFDIDETIEVSNGPVTLGMMQELKSQGHIVGLCGNWALFVQRVQGWHHLISFVNCAPPMFLDRLNEQNKPVRVDKAFFLQELARYIPADEYVMVGNIKGQKNKLGIVCGSEDDEGARIAGWRFIKEDDFAEGVR